MKKLNKAEMKKVWNLIVLISSIVMLTLLTAAILNELEMVRFDIYNDVIVCMVEIDTALIAIDGVIAHRNKQKS
jgi:hypothetical protein